MPNHQQSKHQYFESRKSQVRIGILGSYTEDLYEKLHALRAFLRKNGYNARMAEDVEYTLLGDPAPKDDYKVSMKLIDESDILIFIFIAEKKDEHYDLQSVSMELQHLADLFKLESQNKIYVVLYFQKGLRNEMRGIFTGLLDEHQADLDIGFDFEEVEEIFEPVLEFCRECVEDFF